uniref:Far upstream element binding protein 3 n=1 Tax=Paramormyrops kingsleyae TaxID=1676925 RepID=A0A3B3S107_9TELE
MAELVQGQASVAQSGMKADGFADALHRARQIAAKMGVDPHMNSSPSAVDASLYSFASQKRTLEDGGKMVDCTLAIITEDFRVPDKMVGFIIGRGGEQITKIQLESGCKIQIASDSGGLLERPCTLTGTPESIEQAKRLLGQIVERCRNGPCFHGEMEGNSAIQEILIPASKVGLVIGKGGDTIKQLQERTGVKMNMIQDGPMPTGADKPLRITGDAYKVQQARELVLDIIREKDQGDFRLGRNDFASRLGTSSLDVSVPRFAVGIVIGRNGEMIKKIQNDAGVRIQFKPDDGISPERVAQVMGHPERCQHALHLINELVHTAQERDSFGGVGGSRVRVRGHGEWNMGASGGLQEVTYTIPADKCGLVIGKGGETIKNINQQSGAHVELQRNPAANTDPNVRIFSIRGTPQQTELARQLIDEKIGVRFLCSHFSYSLAILNHCFPIRSSGTRSRSTGPQTFMTGGWGSAYQAWQAQGQQDPSMHYLQSSLFNLSVMEEVKNVCHATANAPQQSSTPDYSAAWAEYYRQQGAYYGQSTQQAAGPGLQVKRASAHLPENDTILSE